MSRIFKFRHAYIYKLSKILHKKCNKDPDPKGIARSTNYISN